MGFIETTEKKIVFGEGWTSIDNGACADSGLGEVVFPKSLKTIGCSSFARSKVKTLVIPGNVECIGVKSFSECKDLSVLRIEEGVKTIDDEAFYKCENLEEVVLPNSITALGEDAFAWCSNLKTVHLPEGIEKIPAGCFAHCWSLEEIVIPNSVKEIGKNAFKDCGLVSVTFPDHLAVIERKAFYKTNIREVRLPRTVRIVGDNAFGNCECLEVIKSHSDTKFYNSFENSYSLKAEPDDSYDKSRRDAVCHILMAVTLLASIFTGIYSCMYLHETDCVIDMVSFAFPMVIILTEAARSTKEDLIGRGEEECRYKRIVGPDYNRIERWLLYCISSLGFCSFGLSNLGTEKSQLIAKFMNPIIIWAKKIVDEFLIPTFHLTMPRLGIHIIVLIIIECVELNIVEWCVVAIARRRAINKMFASLNRDR